MRLPQQGRSSNATELAGIAEALAASIDEEPLYLRGEDVWRGVVSVTFQCAVLRMGQVFR